MSGNSKCLTTFCICCYLFRSVLNILLRYGYNYNLNFVFGSGNTSPQNHNFFETYEFKRKEKNDFPWQRVLKKHEYDIWCFHARWNKTWVRCCIFSFHSNNIVYVFVFSHKWQNRTCHK